MARRRKSIRRARSSPLADISVGSCLTRGLSRNRAPVSMTDDSLRRPSEVKACGVWLEGREYHSGNLTVHNGSLWCAQERTKSKPGTNGEWQLWVKRGEFSK